MRRDGTEEEPQNFGHESPEMGEDQVDVVAAAAEHRVEGVADRTLERASGEAAVGFHVSDHRLDGAASFQVALQRRGHPAMLAGDKDRRLLHAVAAVAAVDEGAAGACEILTDSCRSSGGSGRTSAARPCS